MRRSHATAIGRPVDTKYQSVSFSGTSAATTNAISADIRNVMLYATEDCHIRFGSGTPTAVATDCFLPRATLVMFPIHPGERVAVIQNAAAGTLHVSEMDL